ncbi:hypothetical protein DAT1711_03040 [Enterococcus cecorum]
MSLSNYKKGRKNEMKKVVSLLFVAGLFLAACGNSATTTKESKSTKQEIAVSTPGELSTLG